jgi:hypothetical protein
MEVNELSQYLARTYPSAFAPVMRADLQINQQHESNDEQKNAPETAYVDMNVNVDQVQNQYQRANQGVQNVQDEEQEEVQRSRNHNDMCICTWWRKTCRTLTNIRCVHCMEYSSFFFICLLTGGFWISTMVAASSCCGSTEEKTLPELIAYGSIGLSAIVVGTCIRGCIASSNINDITESPFGIVAYLVGLVYLGLYLWVFIVGILLESKHYDAQPFGLNVLVLMTLSHFVLMASVGFYFFGRFIA